MLVVGAKAPKLVSNELVAADARRARCSSTSRSTRAAASRRRDPTTHSNPTFEVNGSIFYCVANMPGAVPATSTQRARRTPRCPTRGARASRLARRGARRRRAGRGRQRRRGHVTYGPVAEAHGLSHTPLSLTLSRVRAVATPAVTARAARELGRDGQHHEPGRGIQVDSARPRRRPPRERR